MNELITVKQLPIIEEQLQTISEDIKIRVDYILSMDCTEDNYKEIKKYRTDLGKIFTDLETRRKDVKKKVLTPYEQFEEIYKSYVTNVIKPADEQIKAKIQAVEDKLKQDKRSAAEEYFNEYAKALGIDFVSFSDMNVDVTMSISLKKLKEQANKFLSGVCDALELIAAQEYKEEILIEYKKSLNAPRAITDVINRHKAIEAEKAKQIVSEKQAATKVETENKVDDAIFEEEFTAPKAIAEFAEDESQHKSEQIQRTRYHVAFGYDTYNLESIREIKAIMERNGTYEQL